MEHQVELLAVGTELLLGNVVNTNAAELSRMLSGMGLNVYHHTVVGDNPGRLAQALEVARGRADVIITTGGLGPTCDDLTKKVVAQAFGLPLEFHPDSARAIQVYFNQSGREMTENNLQQAYLPRGCTVLKNHWGTAPGCAFCVDGVHVVMLPGPPRECIPMFREQAGPYLAQLTQGVIHSRTLRIFGLGESGVEQLLHDQMNTLTNPTLAPYAKEGEVELRITAKAEDVAQAQAMIAPVEQQVREVVGQFIYGADVSSLEEVVVPLLAQKGLTLGCAESCTGGLIAKRVTDVPGASQVLRGSVVSYTNAVKSNVLGVSEELLEAQGAVCGEVARQMALGAREVLGCDLALATTGVAGPGSDERGNPQGLVFVALATPQDCKVEELHLGGAAQRRDRVRTLAANHALDLVRRYCQGL